MATKTVHIPSIGDVTLYKRRGNRSLRLSIGHDGTVRVSLPYWLPYAAGEAFALGKAVWIASHRRPSDTTVLEHGNAIGKAHHLYFEAVPPSRKLSTHLEATVVRVCYPRTLSWQDEAVQTAARKACIRALRKESEALLPQRLRSLADQFGFTYQSVGVKQLTGRWGSCTSQKDITLNLFLMQLPWHLIDYVLVHELTHTKIMQHGPPFWAEMERHLRGAKSLRNQMRDYHPRIQPREQ